VQCDLFAIRFRTDSSFYVTTYYALDIFVYSIFVIKYVVQRDLSEAGFCVQARPRVGTTRFFVFMARPRVGTTDAIWTAK
jgi:hypothetical protein